MRYLKFLLPFVALVVVDVLFQFGAWEPIASPESHAGMSITKKRALEDPAYRHIDFVALGSSRPVYGLDHAQLAQLAATHQFTYANLTVAGTHWMSIGVLVNWLARHHPEVRGGVIGISVQDLLAVGNGTYELGIVYPFRGLGDTAAMAQHVPFDLHDPATYGLYSGLFAYHEDVQDLLAHPFHRNTLLNYFRALPPRHVLAENTDETANMCASPVRSLADCAELSRQTSGADRKLILQCQQLQGAAGNRLDLRPFLGDQVPPEHLQRARDLIRAQLRAIDWPSPPLIVLMPVPTIWTRDVSPAGTHEWALSVLRPLVDEGRIRLADYTDLFADNDGAECAAFFDLYHNNVAGRQRVMERLAPEIDALLRLAASGSDAEKHNAVSAR